MAEISELRNRTLRYLQKLQDEEKSGATPGKLKSYIGCESQEEFDRLIEHMYERNEIAIMPPPRGGRGRKAPMVFCMRYLRGPQTASEMLDPNFVPKITKDPNSLLEIYAERHGQVHYESNKILRGEEAVERIREVIQTLKRFTILDLKESCAPAVNHTAVELYVNRHSSFVYPERYGKYRLLGESSRNEDMTYHEIGEPERLSLTPGQSALRKLSTTASNYSDLTKGLTNIKARGGIAHMLFDAPEPNLELESYDHWVELASLTDDDLEVISNYGPLNNTNIMLPNYRAVERIWVNDPDYATEENAELLGDILTMEPELTEFEGF